jgi:hypothetical protein
MANIYYIDILNKLVGRGKPIEHDELCCCRLSYEAFFEDMKYLKEMGWAEEFIENNKTYYRSTHEGNMKVIELAQEREKRNAAAKDPNSIMTIYDKIDSCWIDCEKLMPEMATEISIVELHPNFKFVTVIVRDNDGHIGIANRCKQIPTGNQYLDAAIKTTDWHWSKGDFVPTHWMPMPHRVGYKEV